MLATAIGTVTGTTASGCSTSGAVVAELPVHVLVDDCPLYDLEPAPPADEAPVYGAASAGRC